MNKRLLRIAVVALAAGFVLYRHFGATPDDDSHGGGIAIPAQGGGFTAGTLDFTPCELPQPHSAATTAAYCAPFQVPENWDAPDGGRRIALRLALVPAQDEVADADIAVLLAGGPGQSAVESWPQAAPAFAPLRRHRHVLLLDQRGTGGSNALSCGQLDEDEAVLDPGAIAGRTRDCLARVSQHADPRYYTTGMALRDLEAVRQALGAPPFDLIGISYGTRVAQQYARAYPEAVRSIVLDSAVPNGEALGAEFARNLDDALKAQFAACTATPACARAYGDPWADLQRLREALAAQPVEVAYRDPVDNARKSLRLDADSLAMLARLYAYMPETAALLPLTIEQALAGDHAPLVAQLGMLGRELESLGDNAMQLSVLCSEDIDRLQPDPADAGTLLGTRLTDALRTQCTIWPHGTRAAGFNDAFAGTQPVLVLSGELDPVTPPRYAEAIGKGLPNARVLVAKGQGHNVIGRGCFPRLVARFLDHPDPAALDAGCVKDFGPVPAFIDFNGAAP
jgi:pimeloyl-ACP methyl ester carboxylesterase